MARRSKPVRSSADAMAGLKLYLKKVETEAESLLHFQTVMDDLEHKVFPGTDKEKRRLLILRDYDGEGSIMAVKVYPRGSGACYSRVPLAGFNAYEVMATRLDTRVVPAVGYPPVTVKNLLKYQDDRSEAVIKLASVRGKSIKYWAALLKGDVDPVSVLTGADAMRYAAAQACHDELRVSLTKILPKW